MEDQVIRCDFDFGSADLVAFPLPVQTKGSPSHESESGYSEMSDVRSVSPSTCGESGNNLVDFDFNQDQNFQFDDDLDRELESYLGTPSFVTSPVSDEDQSQSPPVAQSVLSTPPPAVAPTIVSIPPMSPDVNVDSDSDSDYMPPRTVQSRAIVHTKNKPVPISRDANTEVRLLNSKSVTAYSNTSSNSVSKPPAVKVVKVIKTQQTTKKGIEDELIQALDARNRKNAVQAKINREKKKAYIKNLEDELLEVKHENNELKTMNENVLKERNALQDEVDYLKNVLANQSALAGLLQNIGNVDNVKLSSSLTRKRNAELDHDYQQQVARKRVRTSTGRSGGVCLHVDNGNVSLEFCSKCAKMADTSSTGD